VSEAELVDSIEDGDTIVVGQVLGEPTGLLEVLWTRLERRRGLRVFVGMSLTDGFERAPAGLELVSSVGMPPNGPMIESGRMRLVPCHMSELPWLVSRGPYRADVAAILVSPPDADGFCSLGVVSDYIWPALHSARVVIAEINENVPVVDGDTRVPFSAITASIVTNRPLPEYPLAQPTALERAIGARVAGYVHDGSCLQVGIGRLGEAVLQAVAGCRDLGVHAGMVGDTLLQMRREGIVTNRRKAIDEGCTVAGSVLGGAKALALAADDDTLRLRSIEHTHNPAVIAQLDDFVCVNSALEVDLFGQVNAEYAGDRYVGAVAGSVDFLRGSVRADGGHAIVALPASTGSGRPRIVPTVRHATALRSDVDVIITEHGVAELRGKSTSERAGLMISVAAPSDRPALAAAADRMGL
jgi:acyl-CoA hydrolase